MPKRTSPTTAPKSTPLLPREYGAWVMFLVPLVIGLGVGSNHNVLAGSTNAVVLLLLFWLTAMGFFLVRYPLMLLIKASDPNAQNDAVYWSGVYSSMVLLGGVVLVIITQLVELVFLGILGCVFLAIYLWLVTQHKEMSVVGEWTSIAGVALSAPGGYVLLTRSFDITALMLYGLAILFFGGSVYYIKYKVREQSRVTAAVSDWRARLVAARAPIVYSVVALIIVAGLVLIGWLPVLALVAMLVPLPKVLLGALERPVHMDVPHLGRIEIVHSIVFTFLVLWAFR